MQLSLYEKQHDLGFWEIGGKKIQNYKYGKNSINAGIILKPEFALTS